MSIMQQGNVTLNEVYEKRKGFASFSTIHFRCKKLILQIDAL